MSKQTQSLKSAKQGYTPGPWAVVANGTLVVVDKTGEHVVDTAALSDSLSTSATARLIAAAPQLLEALKAVNPDDCSIKVRIMREAAIFKAEEGAA